MNDINEMSSKYDVVVDKIDDLSWSFHSNQNVVYFKAQKDGSNYRYRIGFDMYYLETDYLSKENSPLQMKSIVS